MKIKLTDINASGQTDGYVVTVDSGELIFAAATGGGAVDSVNGQTGVVVLDQSDIGLDQVDNTSDIDKPISDLTQSALDLKLNDKVGDNRKFLHGNGAGVAASYDYVDAVRHPGTGDFYIDLIAVDDNVSDIQTHANGHRIVNLADPINDQDAVTKKYVDDHSGAVDSVNGQTGVVVLDADDISGISTVGKSGAYNDLSGKPSIPTKTSDITNDSGFITSADIPADAVTSVAGKTGVVTLTKSDVGLSNVDNTSDADKPISDDTQSALDLKLDFSQILSDIADIEDTYPSYPSVGEGYLYYNGLGWDFSIPSGGLPADTTLTFTGDVTAPTTGIQDASGVMVLTLSNSGVSAGTYKSVTVDLKGRVTAGTNPTTLSGYGITDAQSTLVSGTNIKTVNSTSLLGSGDVAVQDTLVSGTNIKTINGTSLLGSGDVTVGSSGPTLDDVEYLAAVYGVMG